MTYLIQKNNIHIKNSYLINKKKEMKDFINYIRSLYTIEQCAPLCRSNFSLCCEWKAHNRLYHLGIYPLRTKSVDLNYPQRWYEKLGYFILGL